uniref:LITAF domain-containing protein n=1 Tax=Panagrellus redivivus TaxID=6233 RepID=A0A7E4V6J4_PANRE
MTCINKVDDTIKTNPINLDSLLTMGKEEPSSPPVIEAGVEAPPSYNDSIYPSVPVTVIEAPPDEVSHHTVHITAPSPQIQEQPLPQRPIPPAPPVPPVTEYPPGVFASKPCLTVCQYCQHEVPTMVKHVNGTLTWLLFCLMLVFGCWLCCLFPFCLESCKDVEHYCPNCKKPLGVYKKM